MATLASHPANLPVRKEITPQTALRYAWTVWAILLAAPFLLFLYVVWSLMDAAAADRNQWLSDRWFISSVAYMVLVVPASFFVRSRFFRPYWKGERVPPRDYLKGMFTVWGALELGGILSLFGCLASSSLIPSLLPSLAAFMMFVILWPSGRAMIPHSRGMSDDPERYEEPR